jgi:hypothetical protein
VVFINSNPLLSALVSFDFGFLLWSLVFNKTVLGRALVKHLRTGTSSKNSINACPHVSFCCNGLIGRARSLTLGHGLLILAKCLREIITLTRKSITELAIWPNLSSKSSRAAELLGFKF